MTALEYAQLLLSTRDQLYARIREALPVECEMEKRFIQTGVQKEDAWTASLVNHQTGKIRLFVMLMTKLGPAELAATAGAKNFKPSMRLTFELFHDHLQGKDGETTQTEFESDAVKLQFAIESNRNLPPKALIQDYDIDLGTRPSSVRSLHYARGFVLINFREIRY